MMKISILVLLVAAAQAFAIRGTDFGAVSAGGLLAVGLQEEVEHALEEDPMAASVAADAKAAADQAAAANLKAAQNAEDTKEVNAEILRNTQECSDDCATKAATDKVRLETEKGVEGEARNAEAEAKKTEDDVKALTALLKQAGEIIDMIPAKREKLNTLKNKLKLKDLYAESKSAEVVLARKKMHLAKVTQRISDITLELEALKTQATSLQAGIDGIQKIIEDKAMGKAVNEKALNDFSLMGFGNGQKELKFTNSVELGKYGSLAEQGLSAVQGDAMRGPKNQILAWVKEADGTMVLNTECAWSVAQPADAAGVAQQPRLVQKNILCEALNRRVCGDTNNCGHCLPGTADEALTKVDQTASEKSLENVLNSDTSYCKPLVCDAPTTFTSQAHCSSKRRYPCAAGVDSNDKTKFVDGTTGAILTAEVEKYKTETSAALQAVDNLKFIQAERAGHGWFKDDCGECLAGFALESTVGWFVRSTKTGEPDCKPVCKFPKLICGEMFRHGCEEQSDFGNTCGPCIDGYEEDAAAVDFEPKVTDAEAVKAFKAAMVETYVEHDAKWTVAMRSSRFKACKKK